MFTRIAVFLTIATLCGAVDWYWINVKAPSISARIAVQQVNGGDDAAEDMRAYESGAKNVVLAVTGLIVLLSAFAIFGSKICECVKKTGTMSLFAMGVLLLLSGCTPYDKPEFITIENNETGFLLPLEGETKNQAKFASEEMLEQAKVATKRVQITHRWVQNGRLESDGQYIPTVRLIKINRSPVVREWTADPSSGTGKKDESIKVESRDSIGFEIGFSVTAMVGEADSAKFLYWYSSGDLAQVMDTEVRSRIQKSVADECAKYDLDTLRTKKTEIAEAVRKDVTEYYTKRGITITSIGMVGGLHYDNGEIQKAMDETVKKQQLKVMAQAEWEAQQKTNDRITLEAEATAEKVRRIAKGEADAKLIVANAEAEAIKAIEKALGDSQQGNLLLQIKQLEIQKAQIERWNGQYPTYMMNMGGSTGGTPNLLLQIPAAPSK